MFFPRTGTLQIVLLLDQGRQQIRHCICELLLLRQLDHRWTSSIVRHLQSATEIANHYR